MCTSMVVCVVTPIYLLILFLSIPNMLIQKTIVDSHLILKLALNILYNFTQFQINKRFDFPNEDC